jgi:osmotically-inducible protein OsmY
MRGDRGQETTGAYVDDAWITTSVKRQDGQDKNVDASPSRWRRSMAK